MFIEDIFRVSAMIAHDFETTHLILNIFVGTEAIQGS